MRNPNVLVPQVPTIKPYNNLTKTAPLLPKPFDLYKLNQRVRQMQEAKKKAREANSFVDVVMNIEAHKRVARGKWYEDIPIVRYFASSAELMWELQTKQWDLAHPGQALLAILHNMGETLDVVANLVKAPLYAWSSNGNVSVIEAYSKAYGLGDKGQKTIDFADINKNVDWIPDGLFFDLVGEVFTDPMNYVTFGAYAAAKASLATGTKATLKSTAKYAFQNVNKIIGDRILTEVTQNMDSLLKLADEPLEEAIKNMAIKLSKEIGSSTDVIEAGIRYTINQPKIIQGLSAIKASNIGGYVHRLNVAAFRNDYNEFFKIIMQSPNSHNLYDSVKIKNMFKQEQLISASKKGTRFMYAADQVENYIIKNMWKTNPLGAAYTAYRKFLKMPIKGYDSIIQDLEKSRAVKEVLDDEGFTLKTVEELHQEYRTAVQNFENFIKYHKADEIGYDEQLSVLKEYLDLMSRRYDLARYKDAMGINEKQLDDFERKLEDKAKEILVEKDIVKQAELQKEYEELSAQINNIKNYKSFRTNLKNASTNFGEFDVTDYKTYITYKEFLSIFDLDGFKAADYNLQYTTIVDFMKSKGIDLKVEFIGAKTTEETVGKYLYTLRTIAESRIKKIEAMVGVIDLVSYGGPQAGLIMRTLKSPQHSVALNELSEFAKDLQSHAIEALKAQEDNLFKEMQSLDEFVNFQKEYIEKRIAELLSDDGSFEKFSKEHPDLVEGLNKYRHMLKDYQDATNTINSMQYGSEYKALLISLSNTKGISLNSEFLKDFVDDFMRTTNLSYSKKKLSYGFRSAFKELTQEEQMLVFSLLSNVPANMRAKVFDSIKSAKTFAKRLIEYKNTIRSLKAQTAVLRDQSLFEKALLTRKALVKQIIEEELDQFSWAILNSRFKYGIEFEMPDNVSKKVLDLYYNEYVPYKNRKTAFGIEDNSDLIKRMQSLESFISKTMDEFTEVPEAIKLVETNIRQAIKNMILNKQDIAELTEEDKKYQQLIKELQKLIEGWDFINKSGSPVSNKAQVAMTSELYATIKKVISLSERSGFSKDAIGIKSILSTLQVTYEKLSSEVIGIGKNGKKILRRNSPETYKGVAKVFKEYQNSLPASFHSAQYLSERGLLDLRKVKATNKISLYDIKQYLSVPKDQRAINQEVEEAMKEFLGLRLAMTNKGYIVSSEIEQFNKGMELIISKDMAHRIKALGGGELLLKYELMVTDVLSQYKTLIKNGLTTEVPLQIIYLKDVVVYYYMRDLLNSNTKIFQKSPRLKRVLKDEIVNDLTDILNFYRTSPTPKTLRDMSSNEAKRFLDAHNRIAENRYLEQLVKLEEIETLGYVRNLEQMGDADYYKSLISEVRSIFSRLNINYDYSDENLIKFLNTYTHELLEQSGAAMNKMLQDFNFNITTVRNLDFNDAVKKYNQDTLHEHFIRPGEEMFGLKSTRTVTDPKTGLTSRVRLTLEERYRRLKSFLEPSNKDKELEELWRSEITRTSMRQAVEDGDGSLISALIYRFEYEAMYSVIKNMQTADMLHPRLLRRFIKGFQDNVLRRIKNWTDPKIKITVEDYEYFKTLANAKMVYSLKELQNESNREALLYYVHKAIEQTLTDSKKELDNIIEMFGPAEPFIKRATAETVERTFQGSIFETLGLDSYVDEIFDKNLQNIYEEFDGGLGIAMRSSNIQYVNGVPTITKENNLNDTPLFFTKDGKRRARVVIDFETMKKVYNETDYSIENNPAFQLSVIYTASDGTKIRKNYYLKMDDGFEYKDEIQGRFHNLSKKDYENTTKYTKEEIIVDLEKSGIVIDEDTLVLAHNITYDLQYIKDFGFESDFITMDTLPYLRAVYSKDVYKTTVNKENIEMLNKIAQEDVDILKKLVNKSDITIEEQTVLDTIKAKYKETVDIDQLLENLKRLEEIKSEGYSLENLSKYLSEERLEEVKGAMRDYGIEDTIDAGFHNSAFDVEVTDALTEEFFAVHYKNRNINKMAINRDQRLIEKADEAIKKANEELDELAKIHDKLDPKYKAKKYTELRLEIKKQNDIKQRAELRIDMEENLVDWKHLKNVGDLNNLGNFILDKFSKYELFEMKALIDQLKSLENLIPEDTIEELGVDELFNLLNSITSGKSGAKRFKKSIIEDLLDIRTTKDYRDWLKGYIKSKEEMENTSRLIQKQLAEAKNQNKVTLFTENEEALTELSNVFYRIDQIVSGMETAHHQFMSSMYGNSLGFMRMNRTVANWKVKQAWVENTEIEYIRRMLNLDMNTGDPALDYFVEYFHKGIKNALIENEMTEPLAEFKKAIGYEETVKPLEEAISKYVERYYLGDFTKEEQERIFEYLISKGKNITVDKENQLRRLLAEGKLPPQNDISRSKMFDHLLSFTKEKQELLDIQKQVNDFKKAHQTINVDTMSNIEIRELYRKTFPDSSFVQLEDVIKLLDEDTRMQEAVYTAIRNQHMNSPEKLGQAYAKMTEVMYASDLEFKYFLDEYYRRVAAGEVAETVIEDLQERFTREYFTNIMLTKYGKSIAPSEYGDALDIYLTHAKKMISNFGQINNRKFYSTMMNPDTTFTDYLHDVYKDNVIAAMDPITLMKGRTATESEQLYVTAMYKDLERVMKTALEKIRDPLSEIKMEKKLGEMFPIYVGHFKKFLNEAALSDKALETSPWLRNLENLGELGGHSKYVLQYTKKTAQGKAQSQILEDLLDGLRKQGGKKAGERFVAYASSDPSGQRLYNYLEEKLGPVIHWFKSNKNKTSTRIVRVERLDAILKQDNLPEYFLKIKADIKAIEDDVNYVFSKFKLFDLNPDGTVNVEQLEEFMHRIKAAYWQYLQDRKPEEYLRAYKELINSGFETKLLRQDVYNSYKYITTYMGKNFDEVYNQFGSPEELFKFINNPANKDFGLAYLVPDKSTGSGLRIKRFRPSNVNELAKILSSPERQGLMLIDTHQYQIFEGYLRQMFKFKSDSFGDIIRRFIIMPLKSMSLLTLNFTFNNILDITLKNLVSQEGGLFSAESVIKDMITALKWNNIYEDYFNKARKVLNISSLDSKVYKRTWVEAYKLHLGEDITEQVQQDLAIVEFIQDFFKSPSAASEPRELIERIKYNVIGKDKSQGTAERMINTVFYGSKFSPFTQNLKYNSYMESIGRLALHINNLRKGLLPNESLLKVLKTHFNYGNKSKAELYAEFAIPFASYPLRSMEFWPEALGYNNATTKFLVDSMINVWGRDKLDDNEYALYQFSRGNIPIGNNIFQTGFTFMDTLGAPFIGKNNPYPLPEQFTRKLNPLIRNVYQASQGTISNNEAFLRTPGINQIRNVYNLFILKDGNTTITDPYYTQSNKAIRSSYLYRQYMFSKPYSFQGNQLQFKGQFNINTDSMRRLQWKYTTIRPLYIR